LFVLFSDKNSFTITRSGVTEGDYDAFVEEIARKSGKGEIIDLPAA